MSSKQNPAEMDPDTFDLDGWIDGVVRPEATISLYVNDAHFQTEVARIEAAIPAAEKIKPEDRGLDDPSPESLLAELEQLKAQREATALKVRVRQLRAAERVDIAKAYEDAEPVERTLAIIEAAIIEPKFTVAQLRRLYERDASGEAMVDQMLATVLTLGQGLPVPS